MHQVTVLAANSPSGKYKTLYLHYNANATLISSTHKVVPRLDGTYRQFTVWDVLQPRELLYGDPFFPQSWMYTLKRVAVVVRGRRVGCFQYL